MKKLTTLLVKNEEKELKEYLSSLADTKDIIVMDAGSRDNTINVAKSFGILTFSAPGIDENGQLASVKRPESINIPKILHHIWVGPKRAPMEWIKTWREKHPDWKHILWDNDAVFGRSWINQKHINYYKEREIWHGVADVVRYEILFEMGGLMPGADSVCFENTEELFTDENEAYCVYENEIATPGLITPLYACTKNNHFAKLLIDGLTNKEEVGEPWLTTGNLYMMETIEKNSPARVKILPSYIFNPVHKSGIRYQGNAKVYAEQKWGTTFNLY
jgi:mannosyltransferase OCH1-like enzyme